MFPAQRGKSWDLFFTACPVQSSVDNLITAQVASSYAALSALLRAGGRRAEALTYAQVALEAKQRAFGSQHAEVAAAMLHLADILRDLGR